MDKVRKKGLKKIGKYLLYSYAKKLENNIYESIIENFHMNKIDEMYIMNIYAHTINDIAYNLDPENNSYLLLGIVTDKIPIELVNSLPFYELNPSNWKKIIDNKNNIEFKKNDIEDGTYQCRKCLSYKTYVKQIQMRSADEPMTTLVICMLCHAQQKPRAYKP